MGYRDEKGGVSLSSAGGAGGAAAAEGLEVGGPLRGCGSLWDGVAPTHPLFLSSPLPSFAGIGFLDGLTGAACHPELSGCFRRDPRELVSFEDGKGGGGGLDGRPDEVGGAASCDCDILACRS